MASSSTGDHTLAVCPKCEQKLWLPATDGVVHVTCPKCQSAWDWSEQGANPTPWRTASHPNQKPPLPAFDFTRFRFRLTPLTFVLLVFVGVVATVVYKMATYESPGQVGQGTANPWHKKSSLPLLSSEPKLPKPLPSKADLNPVVRSDLPPELTIPENADGAFTYTKRPEHPHLRISPTAEYGHMVVKVWDAQYKYLLCWFFVRKGQSAEIALPAGTYRLKLASGDKWYGETYLFGPDAAYTSIDTDIIVKPNMLCDIHFTRSVDGKLTMRTISPKDF